MIISTFKKHLFIAYLIIVSITALMLHRVFNIQNADVFIYIGDLAPVFAAAKRLLRPGGIFAFSIETCSDAQWRLQDSGRYAQSAHYIELLASEHGFTVALRASQPIRKPIVGLLYVLTRPAPS
jgi:predicted TPR repeat methyltransferase